MTENDIPLCRPLP